MSQLDTICIWVELDPIAPVVDRSFEIFGTGQKIPPGKRNYIGSVQLLGGAFIYHVYENEL